MNTVDLDWAKKQLTLNKTKKVVGDAVLSLLEAWDKTKKSTTKNTFDETVDIFSRLARGEALVEAPSEGHWVPLRPGGIVVADVVRVKNDAFGVDSGKYPLNGRTGVIVAIRSGDIVIKTTDTLGPLIEGAHVLPINLEKLVK